MPMPKTDYRRDPRETQVMMWLWQRLSDLGIKMGPGRASLRGRMYVEQMTSNEGNPSHAEIVAAFRAAKANGYEMSGDLIMLSAAPTIARALREATDEQEHEPA